MTDKLPRLRETITELFLIGDEILCQNQKGTFRLTGVSNDWVGLSPADGEGENIRLDFSALIAALESTEAVQDEKASALLQCFASEYRQRLEQANRDKEVDDMWRSAMTCQL